ncbi:MAG: hypothetical protein RIQ94_2258, partial [Pseudomonadota bacterium]
MNNNLLASYNTLSDNEQQLLQALSVIYAPVGQTDFQELLRKTAVFPSSILATINKLLRDKLQKNELIVISTDGWQCHPAIVEGMTRLAVQQPWFNKLAAFLIADHKHYYSSRVGLAHNVKLLRIFIYQHNDTGIIANINRIRSYYPTDIIKIINNIFFDDFDTAWFESFSEAIKFFILSYFVDGSLEYLTDTRLHYQLLEQFFGASKSDKPEIVQTVIEQRMLRGNFNDAEDWLANDTSWYGLQVLAGVCFLQNRNDEAVVLFTAALKALKKETGKRNVSIAGLYGCFFSLALLRTRNFNNLTLLKQNTQLTIKHGEQDAFYFLNLILLDAVDIYQGKLTAEHSHYLFKSNDFAYERLFQTLLLYWIGELDEMTAANKGFLAGLAKFCERAQQYNFVWYAAVSSALLQRLDYRVCEPIAQQYAASPFTEILDLLPQVSKWQRALDALTHLKDGPLTGSTDQQIRMIWILTLVLNQAVLEPKEQKLGKSGRWSKGRPISLKRLYHNLSEFDYLSEQDRRICAHVQMDKDSDYWGYSSKEVFSLSDEAILGAIGHPHIYWPSQDLPVEISVAEPQLLVKEQQANLHISLIPPITGQKVIAQKTASNGLLVYKINESHRQVAEILGHKGLTVPASARQQVIDSIASVSSMLTVQSDIGGTSSHAETVETDSRLHVHLQPVGQGIQIDTFVQPFAGGGPLYIPGSGGTTVLAEIDGKQLQTTRDFKLEKKYLKQLLTECPELYIDKDAKWLLDDPESALEALLHLQALGDFAVLEWPKGKKIHISREAGLSQAKFSVRKEKDWFSVEGSLQINEQEVL